LGIVKRITYPHHGRRGYVGAGLPAAKWQSVFMKGGITMDYFCPGMIFVVVMIAVWLDDAGFWKWLRKKLK
jgi:hypothetical protein